MGAARLAMGVTGAIGGAGIVEVEKHERRSQRARIIVPVPCITLHAQRMPWGGVGGASTSRFCHKGDGHEADMHPGTLTPLWRIRRRLSCSLALFSPRRRRASSRPARRAASEQVARLRGAGRSIKLKDGLKGRGGGKGVATSLLYILGGAYWGVPLLSILSSSFTTITTTTGIAPCPQRWCPTSCS